MTGGWALWAVHSMAERPLFGGSQAASDHETLSSLPFLNSPLAHSCIGLEHAALECAKKTTG